MSATALAARLYRHFLFLLPLTSEHFNYDQPHQWHRQFPQCLGLRQSPIAISALKAVNVLLPPLRFGLYDAPLSRQLRVHNNGHTVEFRVPATVFGEKPFITGGLLEDIYPVETVHFHWGSAQRKGSEHLLNGRRYDMEMHIVHRNRKYSNVQVARHFTDGLCVIAVLFKVVKTPHVYYPGLNEIYSTLDRVRAFNASTNTADLISLGSLLGHIDRGDFYTYKGSLTTPPCSEAVTWVLFSDVLPISDTELPKFWNILNQEGNRFANVRPLQYSGFHQVYHRSPADGIEHIRI